MFLARNVHYREDIFQGIRQQRHRRLRMRDIPCVDQAVEAAVEEAPEAPTEDSAEPETAGA